MLETNNGVKRERETGTNCTETGQRSTNCHDDESTFTFYSQSSSSQSSSSPFRRIANKIWYVLGIIWDLLRMFCCCFCCCFKIERYVINKRRNEMERKTNDLIFDIEWGLKDPELPREFKVVMENDLEQIKAFKYSNHYYGYKDSQLNIDLLAERYKNGIIRIDKALVERINNTNQNTNNRVEQLRQLAGNNNTIQDNIRKELASEEERLQLIMPPAPFTSSFHKDLEKLFNENLS